MVADHEPNGYSLSRSFLAFLLFCLLLLVASAGVVWYVGITLTTIAFDGDRRQNPYYLLQLLPPLADAPEQEPALPAYRNRFAALAAEEEGRLVWQAGAVELEDPNQRGDLAAVQLLEFASGASLVRMLTSSAYRTLEREAGDRVIHLLGATSGPRELAADEATMLVLYRAHDGGTTAPLGVPGESGWLTLLPSYGGTIGWQAPVEIIRGNGAWTHALLLQFPDMASIASWQADSVTETERAIARRHVDSLVILTAQPAQFSWR
jgi:uncharacterized protein (DUF1330 family)